LLQAEAAQGFSFESGFITEGYSSVAAAVKNHLEMPVAALALTFRSEDANAEIIRNLTRNLMAGAAELSKRLGAH
jgi:DNA-binding IclR family transcriptional regulator